MACYYVGILMIQESLHTHKHTLIKGRSLLMPDGCVRLEDRAAMLSFSQRESEQLAKRRNSFITAIRQAKLFLSLPPPHSVQAET